MNFYPSNILFKYISRNFLKCFLIIVFGFFLITAMLESMEIIRRFSSNQISISHQIIAELAILNSIVTLSSYFPFTAFLASILFFLFMHSRLELLAIKVAGISTKQIVSCLILVISVIGILYITVFDSISAFSNDKIKKIESRICNKTNDDIAITNSGIWFKDKLKNKSHIIYAKAFSYDRNFLTNVRFFEFDNNQNFVSSIYAKKAYILDGLWHIKNAKTIDINGEEKDVTNLMMPTNLTFSGINKMTANPKNISFWSISKYISMLEKIGLSSLRYKVQFFFQLSAILQMIALVLLASVFCINHNNRNSKKNTLRITAVLLLAFPIHFMNNILMALGSSGSIPIFAAAFIMPTLTSLFCWLVLLKK